MPSSRRRRRRRFLSNFRWPEDPLNLVETKNPFGSFQTNPKADAWWVPPFFFLKKWFFETSLSAPTDIFEKNSEQYSKQSVLSIFERLLTAILSKFCSLLFTLLAVSGAVWITLIRLADKFPPDKCPPDKYQALALVREELVQWVLVPGEGV